MKLELSDGMSNNSDFSNDSHNSQMSTADFMTSMGNGILITPTTFIALEGLNSGVPTRTTPTLTPTTLRNIEQTFIELQSKPQSHENEAGFVPPLVHSIGNNQYISASEAGIYTTISNNTSKSSTIWDSNLSQCSSDSNTTSPSPADLQKNMLQYDTPTPTRRNMGGRKPNKDTNISPEEEERRKVRRERNKAAAARCRKRRVDHTNQLLEETEDLEAKKRELQQELQELQSLKEELDFVLETHKPKCRLLNLPDNRPLTPPDVKPYLMNSTFLETLEDRIKVESDHLSDVTDDDIFCSPSPAKRIMLSSTVPISKPNRPSSLNVAVSSVPYGNINKNFAELPGIAITTPSTGLQFNFDSLMGGGTGLTPVSMPLTANCSTQQRIPVSLSNELGSPESCIPPKLVSL